MSDDPLSEADRIAVLEARVTALSSLTKSLLTTLMIHGLVTREEIQPLVSSAEALMAAGADRSLAHAELEGIQRDLPAYLREKMGPAPDPDDHDH